MRKVKLSSPQIDTAQLAAIFKFKAALISLSCCEEHFVHVQNMSIQLDDKSAHQGGVVHTVVSNMAAAFTPGAYAVGSGPSTRRIIYLGNPEKSYGVLPAGQSGVPFDKHYDDQ